MRASYRDVWRLCAALVDEQAAEDLAQETFVRATRALQGFRGHSSARTWVLAIARHVCMDELRARSRRRRMRANNAIGSSRISSSASEMMPYRRSLGIRLGFAACTAGVAGADRATAPAPARRPCGSAIAAAARSAPAASTVPKPDPISRPPGRRNLVLLVSDFLTCAGDSEGNSDLIIATMPVTTALAALVLLIVV